jgi:hypothetical protein
MAINTITGNTLLTSGSFPPVRAASTGAPLNPAAGGLLVVDGVALVAGDRVLVKDEASPVNNGIYAASTGPWTRTTEATRNTQFFSGMAVTVALGAVNAGQTFICTCPDDPVVVGTSLITFASQQAVATATQTATATTSLTIGTGSKTFAVQSGKALQSGQAVLAYETSNPLNQMFGTITAYSGTSLIVNVTATGGSGTHADWTIVLYPSNAAAGFAPPVGTGNVTGPGSSTAGHVATFADATGKMLSDGGLLVPAINTITPAMFGQAAVAFGVGMLNGILVASVAGNALTIAVKTLSGNDPSSIDEAWLLFRDASAGYAAIQLQAALSITVPSGATLGTVNGQANRIWVGVFNNGGLPVLGVYNSLSGTNVLPWDETSPANGTGITSSATSAQLWYTASTLSSKVFRILGYVESTQGTAGQWATSPSKVQLFGPGVKRPGDTVQEVTNSVSGSASTTSATFVALAGENVSIIPSSASNLIRAEASGSLNLPTNGSGNIAINGSVQLSRGTTANTNLFGSLATLSDFGGNSSLSMQAPSFVFGYDVPNTVSSVTYTVQGKTNSLTTLTYGGSAQIAAREIMT